MKEYIDQNPIIIKLKEIAGLINTISTLQDNQIEEISNTLFEISWRVNELPWSLKDHEKYKLLMPWKSLGFTAQFLAQANDSDKEKFIKSFKDPEALHKLEESIQSTLELYQKYVSFECNFLELEEAIGKSSSTNDINDLLGSLQKNTYYTDISQQKSKATLDSQQLLDSFMDKFYFKQISNHLTRFFHEELDYTIEENRIALFRLIELVGENVKNLSEEFKNLYQFVPWQDLANIRNAVEHPEQGEKINKNIIEISEDQTGNFSHTLSLELKQLQELANGVIWEDHQEAAAKFKNQSYKFIKFLASNSILTLGENAGLSTILMREPVTQAEYDITLEKLVDYIYKTPKKDNKKILGYVEVLCSYKYELDFHYVYSFTIGYHSGTTIKVFTDASKTFYKQNLTQQQIKDQVIPVIDKYVTSKKKKKKNETVESSEGNSSLKAEYFIGIFNGTNTNYPGEEAFSKDIVTFCQENNDLRDLLKAYHDRIINRRATKPKKEAQKNNIDDDNSSPIHIILLLTRLITISAPNTLIEQVTFYRYLNKLEERLGFSINKRVWFSAYKDNVASIEKSLLEGLEEDAIGLHNIPELELIRKTEAKLLPNDIPKEIGKINHYLVKLIATVKKKQEKLPYIYQLICEYYIERVGDIAIALLDYPSFRRLNNPESLTPNNLLFLNNLRKLLAHRRFELDDGLVGISVENITNYMQIDLQTVQPVAQAAVPMIAQSYRPKIHLSFITEQFVFDQQDEIRRLMYKYGIKDLKIIGKLVGSNIGILSDLDLVITQDNNSGILEQLRFAWLMSEVLNCTVKTWTEPQLKRNFHTHLSNDYKKQLEESAVSFDKFLQDFETKKKIEARNLYYRTYSDTIVKDDLRDKFNTEDELDQFWDNIIRLGYITAEGKVTQKITELEDNPEIVIEPYPSTLLNPVYYVIRDGLWRSGTYTNIESLEQNNIAETKMSFAGETITMMYKIEEIKKRSAHLKQEESLPVKERIFHLALQNIAKVYVTQYSIIFKRLGTVLKKEEIISLVKTAQELLQLNKKLDQIAANSFEYYYRERLGTLGFWCFKDFIHHAPFPRMYQVKEDGINEIRDHICNIFDIIPDINDLIAYINLLDKKEEIKSILLQKVRELPNYEDAKNEVIPRLIYPILKRNFRKLPLDSMKDYFPENADYLLEIYNCFIRMENTELDAQTKEEFNKKLCDDPFITNLVNEEIAQGFIVKFLTSQQLTPSERSITGLCQEYEQLALVQDQILLKHNIIQGEAIKAWQQLNAMRILIPNVDDRVEFANCYMEYLKKKKFIERSLDQVYENDSLSIEKAKKAIYLIGSFNEAKNICSDLFDDFGKSASYMYQDLLRFAIMPSKEMLPNWIIPRFPELPDIYRKAEREVQNIFFDKVKSKLDRNEYISPTTLARYYLEIDPERNENDPSNHFHRLVEFLLPTYQNTTVTMHNIGLSERRNILQDYFQVIEGYISQHNKLPEKSEVNNMLFKHNITYIKRIKNEKQAVNEDFEFLWNGLTKLTDIHDAAQRNNILKQTLSKLEATYKRQRYDRDPREYLDTVNQINKDYADIINLITQKINRLYNLKNDIEKDEKYITDHKKNGASFQSSVLRNKIAQKQENICNLAQEIVALIKCDKIENYYIYTIFNDLRYFIIIVEKLDYIKKEIQRGNTKVISYVLTGLHMWNPEDKRFELNNFSLYTPPIIIEKFEKLLHNYLEFSYLCKEIITYQERTLNTILVECKGDEPLITMEELETYASNSKDNIKSH